MHPFLRVHLSSNKLCNQLRDTNIGKSSIWIAIVQAIRILECAQVGVLTTSSLLLGGVNIHYPCHWRVHRWECKWHSLWTNFCELPPSLRPQRCDVWKRWLYEHTGIRLHIMHDIVLYCRVRRLECKQRTHLEQIFVSLRSARDAKVHRTNIQTGASTLL